MIYKVFDAVKDEKEINAFIKKHKSRIGKENMPVDPTGQTIRFIFEEEYDPEFIGKTQIRAVWQDNFEKACKQYAECTWSLEMLKRLEPSEVVEERPTSGAIGGQRGMEKITASKAIKEREGDQQKWKTQMEVMQDLLSRG